MASWLQISQAIKADLTTAIGTQTPAVIVGIGWPPEAKLQSVAKGTNSLVSIYDRGGSKDTSRFFQYNAITGTVPAPGITAVLSIAQTNPGGTATLTLSGTPSFTNGDAIGFMVGDNVGVTYTTQSGDTLNTFAANLANAINTNLSAYVTATVVNAVITLTNASTNIEFYTVNIGSGTTNLIEVGRRKRSMQIVVWANSPTNRETIADLIESRLADLQINFGLGFSDGTYGRLTFESDINIDENVLQDVYRRDFIIGLEYGITVADTVYAVLVKSDNITFEPVTSPTG